MKLKQYLTEKAKIVGKIDLPQDDRVSKSDLNQLEKILDRLFNHVGLDIEFTRHFLDRVNNPRNKEQITFQELHQLFTKTYAKFGKQLSKMNAGYQGVLDDIQDDINIPFVLKWDKKKGMIDLISKTVLRKKGFRTSNRIFKV